MTSTKKKASLTKMTTENVNKVKKLASTKLIKMRRAFSTRKMVGKDQRAFWVDCKGARERG